MILRNKTNHFQTIVLKDKSSECVRPYRDVVVPEDTVFDKAVFEQLDKAEAVVEKQKKGN